MNKIYVEYLYPGIIVSESSTERVESRDVDKVEIRENCFAFRFFDREEVEVNGEVLIGKRKNYSGNYFPGGEIFTLERLKSELPEKKMLISNIEDNGYKVAVKHRMGAFTFFNNRDEVI